MMRSQCNKYSCQNLQLSPFLNSSLLYLWRTISCMLSSMTYTLTDQSMNRDFDLAVLIYQLSSAIPSVVQCKEALWFDRLHNCIPETCVYTYVWWMLWMPYHWLCELCHQDFQLWAGLQAASLYSPLPTGKLQYLKVWSTFDSGIGSIILIWSIRWLDRYRPNKSLRHTLYACASLAMHRTICHCHCSISISAKRSLASNDTHTDITDISVQVSVPAS